MNKFNVRIPKDGSRHPKELNRTQLKMLKERGTLKGRSLVSPVGSRYWLELDDLLKDADLGFPKSKQQDPIIAGTQSQETKQLKEVVEAKSASATNELALMAIKGGRYSEAEKLYMEDILVSPSTRAYCGLGLCKINLILHENRSVEEAFYCFERALELGNEAKDKIELEIISMSLSTLEQLAGLYEQLEKEKINQEASAALGAALALGAAAIGSRQSSNGFTQFASLGVAGAGVGLSLEGISNSSSIAELQNEVIELAKSINLKLSELVVLQKAILSDSLEKIPDLSEKKLSIENAKNSKSRKTNALLFCMLFGCLGIHRFYLGLPKSGIAMVFTLGGLGVWALIDFVLIASGKMKDGTGRIVGK